MIIIVPSRGRPKNISELIDSFRDTRTSAHLHVALDADDPELPGYQEMWERQGAGHKWLRYSIRKRKVDHDGMVHALNDVALRYVEKFPAIGFFGDDHRPRTPGWDGTLLADIVAGKLFTYGNDLLQQHMLPTAIVMKSAVVGALGYMVPPTLWHLYVDNIWLTWGRALGTITYHDDVIIEHMHPVIYKSPTDARYEAVNSGDMWAHDEKAYHEYLIDGLDMDVAKLRQLI